ncbi:phosphatase PAP2 family protein [Pandoraea terrae]
MNTLRRCAIGTPWLGRWRARASSTLLHFGIADPGTAEDVSHFYALRSGTVSVLDPLQGLMSFPSFHTITAVLCAYAVRSVQPVFPLAVVLNVVMVCSTPTQGGHYLSDVLAGLAVAVVAILAVRICMSRGAEWYPVNSLTQPGQIALRDASSPEAQRR